jgi:S1-C subfamily serine protease
MMNSKNSVLLLPLLILLTACSDPIKINDITGSVMSVESGNTVTLSNGLTVYLIGIQDLPEAQNYLESYLKGKDIELLVNDDDEQYINDYNTEVYAYVNTYNIAVNGEMLKKGFAKLDFYYLTDSLGMYQGYAKKEDCQELSFEQLFTKYAPATFTIQTAESFGTAFFISQEGLAVSNAHVLNSGKDLSQVRCYLWDFDGKITEHRYRTIHRIVQEKLDGRTGEDDWIIFYVKKDEEHEKFSYYNLNKEKIRQGQKIAVLGTPQGKNGNFTEGTISNIEDNMITISADLNGGNSGGPVFNTCGNVIGIASWAGFEERSKLNLAFDIQPIKEALDKANIHYGGK